MSADVETMFYTREKSWHGLGGSDAGAVCGLNPYSSAMQVFTDKMGDTISEYDNEAMQQGRDFEDYIW